MEMPAEIVKGDHAQAFLLPYLAHTEALLRSALKELDPAADCQILPAADLGIPADVLRLAGGLATGLLRKWDCRVPGDPGGHDDEHRHLVHFLAGR